MARRRFFVDRITRGEAEITGDDAAHLSRVLRVEPGQRYEISDGESLYLAEISLAAKSRVHFRVLESIPYEEPALHVALIVSLIKFDRFEWIVEKATELGATSIVPWNAQRSEKGLHLAAEKRIEKGIRPRSDYLARSLSRAAPWKAEGISRRTWERRRKRQKGT